jgi:hypothetical protein
VGDEVSLKRAQTLFTDKNYKDALEVLGKLQISDAAERYAIYMLKGETMIQLEDFSGGTIAFGQAQKETAKVEEKGMAYAMETLVRRSPKFEYVSKANSDKSFDIKSQKVRKDVLLALLSDETASMQKKVDQVKSATTPVGVAEYGRSLAQLGTMEISIAGKSEACDAMAGTLKERFIAVMDTSLTNTEGRVKVFNTNANKMTTVTIDRPNQQGQIQKVQVARRTGPSESEIAQMKSITTELDKLKNLVTEMTKPLIMKNEEALAMNNRIDAIKLSIDNILSADYTRPAAPNQAGNPGAGGGVRPGRGGAGGAGGAGGTGGAGTTRPGRGGANP